MACYHPIDCWRSKEGRNPLTNKWSIVFKKEEGNILHHMKIACGRCIGCKLERSKQWAIRCLHEASLHEENCFITLTYNDKWLKKRCAIRDEKNIPLDPPEYTLNKCDFVQFMKNLRKKCNDKIRFFQCGEYGGKFERPHHHACMFNLDFPDKKIWKERDGIKLYTSDFLNNIWGKGYCVIGDVNFDSAAYVARYITKKITGNQAAEHYNGRAPEYITMSRRPGIAHDFFEKYKADIVNHDSIVLRGGLTLRPPKYYDKQYEITNPKEMEEIRKHRRQSIKEIPYDRLAVKETVQRHKSKLLKRTLES
ncbi:MAG: replication initiator protein [Arizlama microvirus]|nr:MAG: replication initiator protein [Arizlama microvirus]